MSGKFEGIHNQFHADIEAALRGVARKYGIGFHGVGIAPKQESLIVISRFHGEFKPIHNTEGKETV